MVKARTLAATATMLAAVLAALPSSAQVAGKRVALVVGVDKYESRKLDDLQYAERDAADLTKVLRDAGFTVRTLLGSVAGADAATRDNVIAAVDTLLKGVGKQHTVLIALSGHGQQLVVNN